MGVGVSAHAHEPILSFRNLSAEFDPNDIFLALTFQKIEREQERGREGGEWDKR